MNDRTYTDPTVLGEGVTQGWADPETDPTRIDWQARLRDAAIPFRVVDGRPLNPAAPTGIRYGRNRLGHWGEQKTADVLVTAVDERGRRWIVLIERGDEVERGEIDRWALPGGKVDPGETVQDAAVRELAEETGLDLRGADVQWTVGAPRVVDDPRASDEAWMTTTLHTAWLGTIKRVEFTPVDGGSDAERAEWVPADTYDEMAEYLALVFQTGVWDAHAPLLAEALAVRYDITVPGHWREGTVEKTAKVYASTTGKQPEVVATGTAHLRKHGEPHVDIPGWEPAGAWDRVGGTGGPGEWICSARCRTTDI